MSDRTALALPDDTALPSWLVDEPEPEPALGPRPDPDYREARMPVKADVIAIAEELRADYSLRNARYRENGESLDGDRPGFFTGDEDDIANDIVETMPLSARRDDHDFRCGFLAMHDLYPRLLNRDALDRNEAMAVEDLVTYDFQCEEQQYFREHNADLRWTEGEHLQRFGMLVGLDVLDPSEPGGLAMSLLDPQTIYPVWGGRAGLVEVYRVFEETNATIVGAYGGAAGSPVYQRIEAKVARKATKLGANRQRRMDSSQTRPVIECWNRDWLVVIIDDTDVLLTRKHGYRRLPFTIVVGAFGGPAGVNSGTSREPRNLNTDWGTITVSDRSVDLARQMQPYGWKTLGFHRIAEAVAGRRLTIFKNALDPHKILEYDPATEWKMSEEVDLTPGETTKIPLPNKLTLVTPLLDPGVMAGLQVDLQSNVGGGALTQMRMGAIPPQTSGSAMGKIVSLGGAADTTLVRLLQTFKRERASWRLQLRQTFGGALGPTEHLGIIPVPARGGASTPVHEVTPEIIAQTGTQIDVDLHHWEPDVAMAQYLMTLRTPGPTGRPLASDATLRAKLRIVPDSDREGDRIDDEQLQSLPPVLHQETIARLEREVDEARRIGDLETADRKAVQVVELEFLHEQAIATGQAAPGNSDQSGAPGQPPLQQPPTPPTPPSPALPGTSLPEQGIGVGTDGGRPPGSVEPLTPVTGGGTV